MFSKLLLSAAAFATFANAGIITYSDLTSFLSATGATALTALPLVGPAGASYTNDGTTYTETTGAGMYIGINSPSYPDGWSSLIDGHDIALNYENLQVTLAAPAFSFGFFFDEPSGVRSCGVPTCVDSTFTVTARSGGSSVGSFQFNASDNVLYFVGFSSDVAFNQIEIFENVSNNDDEYFGSFYSGAQPVVSGVPEPSTLTVVATVFALVGLRKFRRANLNKS